MPGSTSPFPEDIFMLAMLLEMHKEMMKLEMMIYRMMH
jgi:hypothetical protein